MRVLIKSLGVEKIMVIGQKMHIEQHVLTNGVKNAVYVSR